MHAIYIYIYQLALYVYVYVSMSVYKVSRSSLVKTIQLKRRSFKQKAVANEKIK